MAVNERIQRDINDLPYGQLAPSQASRESWYPGKRPEDIKAGDATWDKHYRCPVGVQSLEGPQGVQGPVEVSHVRVEKLGRSIICDQTIAAPTFAGTGVQAAVTITIDDPASWGAGLGPQYAITQTDTQDVDGEQERTAGYDWAIGAQGPQGIIP